VPGSGGSAGAGAELRWLPLRVLSQVIVSPLERYPARRWNGSLAGEIRHALTGGDSDRLVELASALAWGMHEMTPWADLHLEGLMRESMVSALTAVELLSTPPAGATVPASGWQAAQAHRAEIEAALENLKSVFSFLRQKDRDVAPLVFLFLSMVAALAESEPRFVDLSLRALRDLGASARLRADALEREIQAIVLADDRPEAQRRREAEWASRPDGAAREAAFWKYEVEKSRRKTLLTDTVLSLRQGVEASALYSEFISRLAEVHRMVAA